MAFFGRPPVDSSRTNASIAESLSAKNVYTEKFVLKDGSEGDTFVLTSNADGEGIWEPNPASSATFTSLSTANIGTAATAYSFPSIPAGPSIRGSIVVHGNVAKVNITIYEVNTPFTNTLGAGSIVVRLPTALRPVSARPAAFIVTGAQTNETSIASASLATSGQVTLDDAGSVDWGSSTLFVNNTLSSLVIQGEYTLTD